MTLDRPVHAPETADGMTVRAVAAPPATGASARSGLAQRLTPPPPPPPDFWPRLAGGRS